ncbi:MAG: outer membrane phospholipase A [Paracoccaceae bacterium]|jgi:outer membrane phospholipase A
MMKMSLAIALAFGSMQSYSAQDDVIFSCISEPNDELRLICYDNFAKTRANDAGPYSTIRLIEMTSGASTYKDESPTQKGNDPWPLEKLEADDPNFFGISWQNFNEDSGVEAHAEFDISLKYPILEWAEEKSRALLIYNGSYDFQVFNDAKIYHSNPVISKTQNPGAVIELDWGKGHFKSRVGFFHHSNGQTLSSSGTPEDVARAIARFQSIASTWGEVPALEQVSRSSNYLQLRGQWLSKSDGRIANNWWQLQLELRHLFGIDDEIFWPPIPSKQPRLQEYDGLRGVGEFMVTPNLFHPAFPRTLLRLELQTGIESSFDNIGGELSLGINFKSLFGFVDTNSLMVSAYYYNGFAKDISSYHIRTKHWGVGLSLR